MKSCMTKSFKMGLVELINTLDHLLYHQPSTDFVPGRTPVCQDSRVEVASLHPVLLSESSQGCHSHQISIL